MFRLYEKNVSDWQAKGITNIVHEKRGGYSKSKIAIQGIAKKAQAAGAQIITEVEVTGFKRESNSNAITSVETSKGIIECEQIIIAVGPWINNFWKMLELPKTVNIKNGNGKIDKDIPMWKYWFLHEGVIKVGIDFLKTDSGDMPPLIHVDSNEPLYSDVDESLITDKMWGIYYKPDIVDSLGVQGGTAPYKVEKPLDQVNVDPYGIASKEYQTDEKFANMWASALAHCQKRFEGKSNLYNKVPSGGLGCFTPDSFPIFDRFCENVYIIADSNHGYKMLGVGKLVAEEILEKESELLKPFRFNSYAKGELHPTSNSPFPWA